MEFASKIKMRLPFLKIEKTLTYNSFEKASWDVYFVTSILKNASSEIEAQIYLRKLVADGSLKEHFLAIFNEVKNMNPETINRILDSSLFPIVKVSKDYSINSYSSLNLAILEKQGRPLKVLSDNYDIEAEMKLFLNENETFVKIVTSFEQEKNDLITYEILIKNNQVLVKILNDWYEIKAEVFQLVLETKCENITNFLGVIETSPEGNQWKLLGTYMLDSFLANIGFYHEKNWYMLESDYWQELTVAKIFENIYFYQLNRIMFSENQKLVEKTLEYLVAKQKYNEVKTKTLLALFLKTNNHDLVQKIINDFLIKKDSKEISLHALKLLMQGITTNWSKKTLEKIKNHSETREQYQELYKINDNLFSFQDDREIILNFPDDILNAEHANQVNKYRQDWKSIRQSIDKIIGDMTTSGVREILKKIPSNEIIKRVKKKLNRVIGHNKTKYHLMSLEKLNQQYQELSNFYQTDFLAVKKMITENQERLRKEQKND